MSASLPPPVAERYAAAMARRARALEDLSAEITRVLAPPPARVLLVEDDEDAGAQLRDALSSALAEAGVTVHLRLVRDASAALAAARREEWAAAVLDLHLGDAAITGLTILRALPPWTPVVLVSGTVPEQLPALADRTRAAAAFAKPVDVRALAAALAALLPEPVAPAPR